MKILLAAFFIIVTLFFSGCEYRMQSSLPSPTAKLAIPLFVNKTFREDLTEVFMQEVLQQFQLRSNFQLVKVEEADFVLKGKLLQYVNEPLSAITTGIDEYRVRVEVEVSLFSVDKKKPLWEERLSQSAIYSMLKVDSLQTEEEAVRKVCQKIGEELVSLTLKGWRE